jgi:hypothetical protein
LERDVAVLGDAAVVSRRPAPRGARCERGHFTCATCLTRYITDAATLVLSTSHPLEAAAAAEKDGNMALCERLHGRDLHSSTSQLNLSRF